MEKNNYNNKIIKKPWGYEYLVFETKDIALWSLHIANKQNTSLHCHPNKTTGLMVVDGLCEISFFSNKFILNKFDKIMIRKGLFHSTRSLSDTESVIFEIENPNNKLDLVRFDDKYGRAGLPYEGTEFESLKNDDCLWIDNDFNLNFNTYANSKLTIHDLTNLNFFNNFDDSSNFIVLNGGISTDYNVSIVGPGDIINNVIAKKITSRFSNFLPKTKLLLLESLDH